jgi:nucleoid DNA-binding protein
MTKTELQNALAEATQTNKRTAALFLDTLSNLAYKGIKKEGEFTLPGFGQLVKQKRKARTGDARRMAMAPLRNKTGLLNRSRRHLKDGACIVRVHHRPLRSRVTVDLAAVASRKLVVFRIHERILNAYPDSPWLTSSSLRRGRARSPVPHSEPHFIGEN